jgi:ABC-type transporter Mla subunit MlaD
MNPQALRFRIGVFVLASLLLLGVLIVLFGSFPRVLSRGKEYTIVFDKAPGVAPGTPVRRSGVRIGEVTGVELDDETGQVRVRIRIDRKYSIHEKEVPTLVPGPFGGDPTIDFEPPAPANSTGGPASPEVVAEEAEDPPPPGDRGPPVPEGTELKGVRQATLNSVLNQAGQVLPTTQQTLNDIRQSLKRWDRLAPRMEETAREYRDLARKAQETIPDLQKTNGEVRDLARTARDAVPEVKRAGTEAADLAKAARETIPDLQKTNGEIRDLARTARDAVPEVKRAATEVADLGKAAREAIPDLKKTNTEAQVTLHTWDRLGERLRLLIQTNEDKVSTALDRLNDDLSRVATALSDENLRNLNATLKNVRAGTDRLESISRNTDELVKESQQTMRRLNASLTRADEVLGNLQQATKPLAERSDSIVKNLDEGSTRLNQVLAGVQALLRAIDTSDGTLRRFLTDPSLYTHLDEAACLLTRTLPRVDRVLRDVEVFADKIARHPESLGVRGAIQPSSGLKEAPSAPPLEWSRPPGH